MWFAPKQNTFLPLGFIKKWVMFLQAISVESNEAPRKTFPAGHFFFFFFLSWSSGFSIYHDTKKSSQFPVTCSNRITGTEAWRPVQNISKGKACSGRYNKERTLEGSSRVYIGVYTLFLVLTSLCLNFRSWFLSYSHMLKRRVCHPLSENSCSHFGSQALVFTGKFLRTKLLLCSTPEQQVQDECHSAHNEKCFLEP